MQWSLFCYLSGMKVLLLLLFSFYIHRGIENVEADRMSLENGDFNNHRGVKLNFYIIRTHKRKKN